MKNVILLDLETFSNSQEIKSFVEKNFNFDTFEAFVWKQDHQITPDTLTTDLLAWKNWGAKKLWIDTINHDIIAYETSEGYKFADDFVRFIENIKPVGKEDVVVPNKGNFHNVGELSVDTILDKISKHGIGSLTKEEKEYLDNNN